MNKEQHNKWLRKHGVHPEQLRDRKSKRRSTWKPSTGIAKNYYGDLANTVAPPVFDTSLSEKLRTGNESSHTLFQIRERASRVDVGYNKGGLQVLSKEELKNAGRK